MPQKDLIKYLIVYLSLHDHYDSSFFYTNGKETVKFKPKQNIAKDLLTVVDVSIYWGYSQRKAPSNETPALTKGRNMGIWVVGTSNQLFIRGF